MLLKWLIKRLLGSGEFARPADIAALSDRITQLENNNTKLKTQLKEYEEEMALIRGFCTGGATANTPPVAEFSYVCDGLSCEFDATGSFDPDGIISTYTWDFGDGTPTTTGAGVTHSYAAGGTYDVQLTVTDDGGLNGFNNSNVAVTTLTLTLGPDSRLVTDGVAPTKPAKGATYTDHHYNTTVRRATDAQTDVGAGEGLRPWYSRRNPFNSDNTMMIVENDTHNHLVNPNDGSVLVSTLHLGPDSIRKYTRMEYVWHYTDPTKLVAMAADPTATSPGPNILKFASMDMANIDASGVPARTMMIDLTDVTFEPATDASGEIDLTGLTSIKQIWTNANRAWTRFGEGTPSKTVVTEPGHTWEGYPRYWVWTIESGNYTEHPGNGLGAVTYDLQTNKVTGVLDYSKFGRSNPDHVDMSWSGDYAIIAWSNDGSNNCAAGAVGTHAAPCGLMAYTRDFKSALGLFNRSTHADSAVDSLNNDVYAWVDWDTGPTLYYTILTDLDGTKVDTGLYGVFSNFDQHISGNNFNKPGWVVVSPYDLSLTDGENAWFEQKIIAVELDATSPRNYVLGHTYSRGSTDFRRPTAAVNLDLTRIAFASNFDTSGTGSGSDLVDTYVIELPSGAIPTSGS